jgi:TP901 family phage tail tape measure protein
MPVKVRIAAIDRISKVIDKVKGKFPELSRSISRTNTMFGIVQKTTEKFRKSLEKVGNTMKGIGKAAMVGITLPVVAAAGFSVKKFMELEQALADVKGATNLSGEELKEFGKRIQNISKNTPATQEELLKLAAAAGDAGVRGVDNLEKFSMTLVRLGKTAGINGEEAAESISKILKITGEGAGNVENFGSALDAVASKYGVNAKHILDSTFAITREVAKFGVSSAQATAFAAAVDPLGFNAKQAAAAFGDAFRGIDEAIQKGGKQMQGLQAITGMTAEQLKEQFGKDSTVVLQKFLGGLEKIRKNGGPTADALKFFGASGDKTQIILEALAKDGTKFNEMLEHTKKAYIENTSLADAYAEETATLSAKFQIFQNKVTVLAQNLGERLAPAFIKILDFASGVIDFFDEHPKIAMFTGTIIALVAILGPLIFAFGWLISMVPVFMTGLAALTSVLAGFKIAFSVVGVIVGIVSIKFIIIAAIIIGLVVLIWKFRDAIKEGMIATWDWLTEKISFFITKAKEAIDVIKKFLGFGGSSVDATVSATTNANAAGGFAPQGAALGGIETATKNNPELMTQTNNARVDINVRAPQSTTVVGESQGGFLNINRGLAGAF